MLSAHDPLVLCDYEGKLFRTSLQDSYCQHRVRPEPRELGQIFRVDLSLSNVTNYTSCLFTNVTVLTCFIRSQEKILNLSRDSNYFAI